MKRLAALLLLLCLLLPACGTEASLPTDPPAPTEAPPPVPGPEPPELPELSPEQSRAMARVLGANRVLLWEGRLYCYDFDAEWRPALASYRWEDGQLSEYTLLASGCVPEYLCALGEALCYIDRASGDLERVSLAGGERETLYPGPCSCLSVREGRLHFLDGAGRFLFLDPTDGESRVLLDGPCAFAYPLPGALLWLALDGSGIHLSGESTVQLFSGFAQAPLLLGDTLWFCSGEALYSLGPSGELARLLPEHSGAVELLPTENGLLVRGISEENGVSQWEGPPDGPFRALPHGYRICDWLGGGLQVDTVYEPDGRIRCYLLQDDQGHSLRFLAGEVE